MGTRMRRCVRRSPSERVLSPGNHWGFWRPILELRIRRSGVRVTLGALANPRSYAALASGCYSSFLGILPDKAAFVAVWGGSHATIPATHRKPAPVAAFLHRPFDHLIRSQTLYREGPRFPQDFSRAACDAMRRPKQAFQRLITGQKVKMWRAMASGGDADGDAEDHRTPVKRASIPGGI
jgi:hypothetical protein